MSFPHVSPDELNSEGIMRLLESGAWFYGPGLTGENEVLIRRTKDGYVIESNDETQEVFHAFPATRDGVIALAFFLAFAGAEYI